MTLRYLNCRSSQNYPRFHLNPRYQNFQMRQLHQKFQNFLRYQTTLPALMHNWRFQRILLRLIWN